LTCIGASKSTEALAGLDRRIHADDDLDHLKAVPHLARLVRVFWELGAHLALAALRLRAWARALGFRGHWSTRSRRYSTTFTALRRGRDAIGRRWQMSTLQVDFQLPHCFGLEYTGTDNARPRPS
jgi:hypothetical protein